MLLQDGKTFKPSEQRGDRPTAKVTKKEKEIRVSLIFIEIRRPTSEERINPSKVT